MRDLLDLTPKEAMDRIAKLPQEQFVSILSEVLTVGHEDRKENQLRYYKPNSETGYDFHRNHEVFIRGIGGGNRSGKTTHSQVEMIAKCTGVLPGSLEGVVNKETFFRGPIRCRFICESLTMTLHDTILKKLKYWYWNGLEPQGGEQGHWGWIPKDCLIGGSWDKSWSEKLRTLRILYRNPDNYDEVLGESSIQFASFDQNPEDFASGEFHLVAMDEPPPRAIWTENLARVASVGGQIVLSMTWPDDPEIAVDWIYDEIYTPGIDGSDPDIKWFEFDTRQNPNIDQEAWSKTVSKMTDKQRQTREKGQPIRFSNKVHPLFTRHTRWWCFACGDVTFEDEGACLNCKSGNIVPFKHIETFDIQHLPTIYLIDPHPRKPHMMMWVQVDAQDDYHQIMELCLDGDPLQVKNAVDRIEQDMNLDVCMRLMDPNMGASPGNARKREATWQDEFGDVGLHCDFANDSYTGRTRVNTFLQPDSRTMRPRIRIHERCVETAKQMDRYVWDDYRLHLEKDQKQTPKTKNDDFPTLWKYLMNAEPTFSFLRMGPVVGRRMGQQEHRPKARAWREAV